MPTIHLPDLPPPAEPQRDGIRRWNWYDNDRDEFLIDAGTDTTHAVLVAAGDGATWLTAVQCRQAAAVLWALADQAEAGSR